MDETKPTRLLNAAIARTASRLCVGLDPDAKHLPAGMNKDAAGMRDYLLRVIEATHDLVCAYKPNLAFFEAMGRQGYDILKEILAQIPGSVLTIGDAKRGDIGNTSKCYARALFEDLKFGAATVNPLMGSDCVEPFLEFKDRLCFLLCLTSNPGADDFLLPEKLYLRIARKAAEWNSRHGNVGLVVGATRPEYVAEIRAAAPALPFLIPGVGAQGGEIERVVQAGRDDEGQGLIFNVSRAILYAGTSADDFAVKAREAAMRYRDAMNAA
ncbi:MAG: orotidine-5'-phosphate decarboxylase [Candidatus Sumerlaeota bacterium]|nr:orotidine-5'-phosphate decarboxylase [Candidatus Sumerlaeota bacterium]